MGYRMINHYCDRLIEKNESISQNTNEKDFYIEYNGISGKVLIYEIKFCPYCGWEIKF